jgi:hypothetical protein
MRGVVPSVVRRLDPNIDHEQIKRLKEQYPIKFTIINPPIFVEMSTKCFERSGRRLTARKLESGEHWLRIGDCISKKASIQQQVTNHSPEESLVVDPSGESADSVNKGIQFINEKFYHCRIFSPDYVTDDWFKIYSNPHEDKQLTTFCMLLSEFDLKLIIAYVDYKCLAATPYYTTQDLGIIQDNYPDLWRNVHAVKETPGLTFLRFSVVLTYNEQHEFYNYYRQACKDKIIVLQLLAPTGILLENYCRLYCDLLVDIYPRDLALLIFEYL